MPFRVPVPRQDTVDKIQPALPVQPERVLKGAPVRRFRLPEEILHRPRDGAPVDTVDPGEDVDHLREHFGGHFRSGLDGFTRFLGLVGNVPQQVP